jgi:hypothetical protein
VCGLSKSLILLIDEISFRKLTWSERMWISRNSLSRRSKKKGKSKKSRRRMSAGILKWQFICNLAKSEGILKLLLKL